MLGAYCFCYSLLPMRYLRMLSNSAFAGLLAAAYFTLLLLLLNPEVPLGAAGPVLTVIVLSYGLHITVVSYVLYVLRQIVIVEPSPPGWISLRLLTWSAAVLSGTAAVITWLHASGLRTALDPRAVPMLGQAIIVFALAAFVFLVLGLAQNAADQRRRTIVGILFTAATILSIVAPLSIRGTGLGPLVAAHPPSTVTALPAEHPRVVLLCLDGASLDVISPAVAAGRLPNFGRMLDAGASMHLATTRPTQPEPVWASIMTGMWPSRHGDTWLVALSAFQWRRRVGGAARTTCSHRHWSASACWLKSHIRPPVSGHSLCGELPPGTACEPG